jgi:hypothetical protein
MNKKIIAILVLIAILLAGAFAGTIFYYNGEIANQNSQISNLKSQLANLTSANLVTKLGITEIPSNYSYNVPSPLPYNYLYITGNVTNTGEGTAYNSGLHVVAYDANGELKINMTVPLVNGASFGTDAGTDAYVSSSYGSSSLRLGSLYSEQTAIIEIGIFHEGIVSNWTITPVWRNSP